MYLGRVLSRYAHVIILNILQCKENKKKCRYKIARHPRMKAVGKRTSAIKPSSCCLAIYRIISPITNWTWLTLQENCNTTG